MSFQSYMEDSSQWGNYQYVTLEQIINDFIANQDKDDYTANAPRRRILYQAMRGIRELYYDTLQEIKAFEIELGPTLTVVLPPDFVNYVRISYVGPDGLLRPMSQNDRMNISRSYLQDHNYNILFDKSGCVMTDDSNSQDYSASFDIDTARELKFMSGYTPNLNLNQHHKNGSYRFDKANGTIHFSSDVKSKNIVIEYISDGLYQGTCGGDDIKVHKFAEEALINFIYYNLIKQRRNVPANEKQRARKEYYNSQRIAGRRINTMRKAELIQALSGSTMNIEPSN